MPRPQERRLHDTRRPQVCLVVGAHCSLPVSWPTLVPWPAKAARPRFPVVPHGKAVAGRNPSSDSPSARSVCPYATNEAERAVETSKPQSLSGKKAGVQHRVRSDAQRLQRRILCVPCVPLHCQSAEFSRAAVIPERTPDAGRRSGRRQSKQDSTQISSRWRGCTRIGRKPPCRSPGQTESRVTLRCRGTHRASAPSAADLR